VSCRLKVVAAILLSLVASPSLAVTVVTACGTDDAAGGMNLKTALAAGGDITIQCAAAPNEIKFKTPHALAVATTIDGNGVTLIGTGDNDMFSIAGPQLLKLRNLSIRNPPSNPADPEQYTGVVYDSADVVHVELDSVQVSETRLPFAVRKFTARNSTFTANGDAGVLINGVVMAGDLELDNVTFRDNLSRPFSTLWRGDPLAKKQKMAARVLNSTFERNKRPVMWILGDLIVTNSTFTDNGDAAPFAKGRNGTMYGGKVHLETAGAAGGALETLHTRAVITRSKFKGNRGMLGGAVYAVGASLTVQSSEFDGNLATSGGAIGYLSAGPVSSLTSWPLNFRLSHSKLRANEAAKDGGALFVLGDLTGDAVLMSDNKAGQSGGAMAMVGPGITIDEAIPPVSGAVLPALPFKPNNVALMRTFVLDNIAVGDAIEGGGSFMRFGNTLVARNTGKAAIHGQNVELANSTVIGNKSDGLRIDAGGTQGGKLANAIVAENINNCAGTMVAEGPNLQFPGGTCGAGVMTADPSLDSRFVPTMMSPARKAGALAICASHDLVDGRDLYGEARGADGKCSIGAAESDVVRDVIKKVGEDNLWWLLLLILIFLVVCPIAGVIFGLRRRRRKTKGT